MAQIVAQAYMSSHEMYTSVKSNRVCVIVQFKQQGRAEGAYIDTYADKSVYKIDCKNLFDNQPVLWIMATVTVEHWLEEAGVIKK